MNINIFVVSLQSTYDLWLSGYRYSLSVYIYISMYTIIHRKLVSYINRLRQTLDTSGRSFVWAQYLRQGIVMKTRVSRMGLGSFVNINIFLMKYYFNQFVYILVTGVSFNDTLLSFGLCHFTKVSEFYKKHIWLKRQNHFLYNCFNKMSSRASKFINHKYLMNSTSKLRVFSHYELAPLYSLFALWWNSISEILCIFLAWSCIVSLAWKLTYKSSHSLTS